MFKVHASTPTREAAAKAYLQGTTRLDVALRMVRADGTVFAWTRAQEDIALPSLTWGGITIPATTYISGEGDFPRDITQSRDITQTDTWEFRAFTDPNDPLNGYVKEAEVSQGRFHKAQHALILFARDTFGVGDSRRYAWLRQRGRVGDKTLDKGVVRFQMNGLARLLDSEVLDVTSPLAKRTWGDYELNFFNLNGNTSDGYAARTNTTVTSVGSDNRRQLTVAALSGFPNGRFTDGSILWTSGPNSGASSSILDYNAGTGALILDENTPYPIAAGHGLRAQIKSPSTIEEWRLFFGDGSAFPGEPGMLTRDQGGAAK